MTAFSDAFTAQKSGASPTSGVGEAELKVEEWPRDDLLQRPLAAHEKHQYVATRNRWAPPNAEHSYSTDSTTDSSDKLNSNIYGTEDIDIVTEAPTARLGDGATSMVGRLKFLPRWIINATSTKSKMMQIPVAIGLSVFVGVLAIRLALFITVPVVCSPAWSHLSICNQNITVNTTIDVFIAKGLQYGSTLEEMQAIGADTVELPYYLRLGEGAVRSLVVELSAVDIPSKGKLMSLLAEYRSLTDQAIDGQQRLLSTYDSLVDKTILIHSWGAYELAQIEKRDSSILAIATQLIGQTFGLSLLTPHSTEIDVRNAFFGLTEKIQGQVSKALFSVQAQLALLDDLRTVLDDIAFAAKGDGVILQREKLSQSSYWKWLFASYRDTMRDFDARMDMCARFYAHTEQAVEVINLTRDKMVGMKEGLRVFREGLEEAGWRLEGGGEVPLGLYLGALRDSVVHLERARGEAKVRRLEKVTRLQASLEA